MGLALTKDVGSIILTNRIAATSGFQGVSGYSATKAVVALDRQQRTFGDTVLLPVLELTWRCFKYEGLNWLLVTRSTNVSHLRSFVA
jgi:hypothetical protein